jgi:hypothetical protein
MEDERTMVAGALLLTLSDVGELERRRSRRLRERFHPNDSRSVFGLKLSRRAEALKVHQLVLSQLCLPVQNPILTLDLNHTSFAVYYSLCANDGAIPRKQQSDFNNGYLAHIDANLLPSIARGNSW